MAEDYLTDDEQVEVVKRWLTENGPWLLAGALLGAALLFGYRFYESHRTARALQAAAQFDQMTAALGGNDRAGARRIAAEIVDKYAGGPYADHAQLTLARMDVDDGKFAAAAGELNKVMDDSKDTELRKIARLRLARVQIAMAKPDEAIDTLAGGGDPGAFAALYHEVRGDALYAKKDRGGALAEYQRALAATDPSTGDTALLTLKITDLGAAPASPGPAAKPAAPQTAAP